MDNQFSNQRCVSRVAIHLEICKTRQMYFSEKCPRPRVRVKTLVFQTAQETAQVLGSLLFVVQERDIRTEHCHLGTG